MNTLLELYYTYLSRIENIANKLFELKITSAQDLWQMEIDLVNFQIEMQKLTAEDNSRLQIIQNEIKSLATHRKGNWKENIQQLQTQMEPIRNRIEIYSVIHAVSRRFGDALTWLFFQRNEQNLLPLTENRTVPSTSTGIGLKGMLAIAENLGSQGAGFPVLHDMSSILRIGDITFITPDEEPVTVEVKTHAADQGPNPAILDVEVHAFAKSEWWKKINSNLQLRLDTSISPANQAILQRSRVTIDNRLRRQIDRMKKAKVLQAAEDGVMINMAGHRGIVTSIPLSKDSYHWDVVRELTIEAKRSGYAHQVIDDAFVYAALYADEPSWLSLANKSTKASLERIPKDLAASPIWYTDTKKNALWFGSTWSNVCGDVLPHITPIFLYPLPHELILEMIRGRLEVLVFVNLGKIVEALNNAGLIARLPTNQDEQSKLFIPVSTQAELSDGSKVTVHLRGLHYFAAKLVHEFITLQTFIDFISVMTDTVTQTVKDKKADDLFADQT